MTTSPPVELAGLKLGNYRLERVLGRGRMGVVYLARDEALLRPTAIKILAWAFSDTGNNDPEAWFLAEARNIARVNHPSVIQVYGVAKHGPYRYIAMEFVDGVPADKFVERSGPFSAVRATEILLQVASALQAAHSARIVHRDVKPANILIRKDGTAKLGDFGMALSPDRSSGNATQRAGTPQYTAPEIWRSEAATSSTDLYALGATYFFLLTGHPPYEATDLQSLISAHLRSGIPDPRDLVPKVPESCCDIILRCLAKTPDERFESAQVLAWELRGLLRSLGTSKPMPLDSSRPSSGRWRILRAAGPDPSLQFFGFARAPFGDLGDSWPVERYEPFASVAHQLRAALVNQPGITVCFTGERGSGRRELVRRVLASPSWKGLVGRVTIDAAPNEATLHHRICHSFGAVSNPYLSADAAIEGLLEYLESVRGDQPETATLVLDIRAAPPSLMGEIAPLARAAWATKYLSIILVGSADHLGPSLIDALQQTSPQAALKLNLPPLTPAQMLTYLNGMLSDCLTPSAPPVRMTPDAAFLIAHRSAGNLARASQLATNALLVAGLCGCRIISSWEAWTAPDTEPVALAKSTRSLVGANWPRRGPDWPPKEVLDILDAARQEAGCPPRPRGS